MPNKMKKYRFSLFHRFLYDLYLYFIYNHNATQMSICRIVVLCFFSVVFSRFLFFIFLTLIHFLFNKNNKVFECAVCGVAILTVSFRATTWDWCIFFIFFSFLLFSASICLVLTHSWSLSSVSSSTKPWWCWLWVCRIFNILNSFNISVEETRFKTSTKTRSSHIFVEISFGIKAIFLLDENQDVRI